MSRLLAAVNGTEYFIAGLIAIPLIERVGRRRLMLFGAFVQMSSMIILAVIDDLGAPRLNTLRRTRHRLPIWIQHLLRHRLAGHDVAVSCRDHKFTHTCPGKCAEHVQQLAQQLSNRYDHAAGISESAAHTYTMFAGFNAALLPAVYIFFPEPKGRSLEELDVIFAKAHAEGASPVKMPKMPKKMPKFEGEDLDIEIARYWGGDVEEVRTRHPFYAPDVP